MVREAIRKGIRFDYLLVDSWFTCAYFNQTINGTMELSVTERIWDLILQIVSAIADLFSVDEEAIIRMIANDNEKIAVIKKLCTEKNTA